MSDVFGELYASYYELLYKDKDYAEEAAYIDRLLRRTNAPNIQETGEILELGCGTGRHAALLAERGYSVHGVDRSNEMLAVAKRRADDAQRLTFSQGDATSVVLDRRFDHVVSLFHVLSYQTSNPAVEAMFRTASNHLKPGGTVIFDFWHGPGVLTDPPVVRIKRLEGPGISIVRLSEPALHPDQNTVEVKFTVQLKREGDSATREMHETHLMRYFTVPELEYFMRQAGLRLIAAVPWLQTDGLLGCQDWYGVIVGVRL